jgi:hypothetical protein
VGRTCNRPRPVICINLCPVPTNERCRTIRHLGGYRSRYTYAVCDIRCAGFRAHSGRALGRMELDSKLDISDRSSDRYSGGGSARVVRATLSTNNLGESATRNSRRIELFTDIRRLLGAEDYFLSGRAVGIYDDIHGLWVFGVGLLVVGLA